MEPINRKKLLALHATLIQNGVEYGYGAKAEGGEDPRSGHRWNKRSTGKLSTPVDTIENIDCSGIVRFEAYQATGGKLILPDGSQAQRSWCKEHLEPCPYSDFGKSDNVLRIGFMTPGVKGVGSIGHVWLGFNARTLESYGGHGAGSHPWHVYSKRVSASFVVPSVSGVTASKPTTKLDADKHDPPILVINAAKKPLEGAYNAAGHWYAMDGKLAEALGYTSQTPSLIVPVQQAVFAHGFVIEEITGRLKERGRVDMRIVRAG